MEHLTGPLSPLSADDVPAIVAAGALSTPRRWPSSAARCCSCVRCRAPGTSTRWTTTPSAGSPRCWDAVGRATAEHGVRLALHVDFLSALRRDHVPALLDRTDPALVGLALDTGELTVGGHRPARRDRAVRRPHRHVQFKDALAVDDDEEYLQPHAHWTVRVRGERGRSRAGSPSPAPTAASSTSRRSPARCWTPATPAGSWSRATRARTPPPAPAGRLPAAARAAPDPREGDRACLTSASGCSA